MANLETLDGFLTDSNLAFRAACNLAVPPEQRPIRRRVIRRVASTCQDSIGAVSYVLDKLPYGPMTDQDFAVELAKDACWQTLVSEIVRDEREWGDLLTKSLEPDKFRKVVDWIKSLGNKAGANGGPIGKLASALLVTSFGAYSVHLLIKSEPVKVDFTPTRAVGVSFMPSDASQKIPIGLTFDTPKDPMKVQFVPDGKARGEESPTDVLKQIADRMREDQKSLNDAQEELAMLAHNSDKWNEPDLKGSIDRLSGEVATASSNLNQIGGKVGTLSDAYNSVSKEQIRIAEDQSHALQAQIPVLYHALQRSTVSVEIPLHSSKAVALQRFDSSNGKLSASSVTISFDEFTGGPDGGSAHIRVRSDDGQMKPANLLLRDGGSTILEGIAYRLTVSALPRYWVVEHKLVVTLTPEIAAVEQNRPVLKASSVDEKASQAVASN